MSHKSESNLSPIAFSMKELTKLLKSKYLLESNENVYKYLIDEHNYLVIYIEQEEK